MISLKIRFPAFCPFRLYAFLSLVLEVGQNQYPTWKVRLKIKMCRCCKQHGNIVPSHVLFSQIAGSNLNFLLRGQQRVWSWLMWLLPRDPSLFQGMELKGRDGMSWKGKRRFHLEFTVVSLNFFFFVLLFFFFKLVSGTTLLFFKNTEKASIHKHIFIFVSVLEMLWVT